MKLTFDDGPSTFTSAILDVLREYGVSASFFLVGMHVVSLPDLARRIVAEGHVVGNHSWDHPLLPDLAEADIAAQLDRTNKAIERVTGVVPELFRPPCGARDERVDRVAAALGMRTVLWDVDPKDFSLPGVAAIVDTIRNARPGAVVLLHDGGGQRHQTVQAVRVALAVTLASSASRWRR